MKLSTFIQSQIEPILLQWDKFARTNEPEAGDMSDRALRDHAREMLIDIAREMDTVQTERQRKRKSEGHGARMAEVGSAASLHGLERQSHNFTLTKLGAEFRALRATVLRLWQPHIELADPDALEQVIRFNEGVDKALAESIAAWSDRTGQVRELFLAILGHDLRSPLATVALAGDMLEEPGLSDEHVHQLARNVSRATRIMGAMINDLMGYTSTQLGGDMPHHPEPCDAVSALQDAIADAASTYPGTPFRLDAPTALPGCYDRTRLYQMFLNLLVNAARHSTQDHAVAVEAGAGPGGYLMTITNHGEPIPVASLESIFQPLVQLENADAHLTRPRTSLGLGLYIARKIAERHGGNIDVSSSEADGTRFSVRLPAVGQSL